MKGALLTKTGTGDDVHPGKLTWNPKLQVWKITFLFN